MVVVLNPCLELVGLVLAQHNFGVACYHDSHHYTVLVVQLDSETSPTDGQSWLANHLRLVILCLTVEHIWLLGGTIATLVYRFGRLVH